MSTEYSFAVVGSTTEIPFVKQNEMKITRGQEKLTRRQISAYDVKLFSSTFWWQLGGHLFVRSACQRVLF